jgi:hypothetical protein
MVMLGVAIGSGLAFRAKYLQTLVVVVGIGVLILAKAFSLIPLTLLQQSALFVSVLSPLVDCIS